MKVHHLFSCLVFNETFRAGDAFRKNPLEACRSSVEKLCCETFSKHLKSVFLTLSLHACYIFVYMVYTSSQERNFLFTEVTVSSEV